MKEQFSALLVYDQAHPLELLDLPLKEMAVEVRKVRTCDEAADLIKHTHPQIVFTDTHLSDGSWVDILNMATEAEVPTNVIVVGTTTDTQLYVSAIERGAFDFVVPPFEHEGLAYVVRSAEQDVRSRREALARAAVV